MKSGLDFLKKVLPVMAIVVLFGTSINVYAQTQTPLQARLAQKNDLGKDTIIIEPGQNGTWYVVNKQDLNGIEYAFLISYRHLNSQNSVNFSPLESPNIDYATSNLRNEMNWEYPYIPEKLKDIAVVANLGSDVNSMSAVSKPTEEMAGRKPANSKYVLFAPSHKEVTDWNTSLGCGNWFCPEITHYYWAGNDPNGRWWTRTTDPSRPTTHKYEVNPGATTFVGIPVKGGKVCMVGAIWVQSGVPYAGDYVITYKANNGTTEPDYLQYENSTNVNVTITTAQQAEAGFTPPQNAKFTGWNTKADGTGTAFAAGANMMIHSDTTLFAQWKFGYTLYGTVFPFVHNNDEDFDTLFTIIAKLYTVPQCEKGKNPIKSLLQNAPVKETKVVYYDGTIFVPTTPLHPGSIGSVNNPGLPINWTHLKKTQGYIDNEKVTPGVIPDKPVGIYRFDDVEEGWYILMLWSPGFAFRFAKIEVNSNTSLGHRELIPGDINADGLIDHRDLGIANGMWSSFPEKKYKIWNDLNKDRVVDLYDSMLIIESYGGFSILFYEETWDWMMGE